MRKNGDSGDRRHDDHHAGEEVEVTKYHKIQTIWHRDPQTNHKTLLEGEWSRPEFAYLQDNPWEFTEKVDGTNVRLLRERCEARGRTDKATLHVGLQERCREIMGQRAFLDLPESMVLYGEGFGAKIQKGGGNYSDTQDFVLFDVWCENWLDRFSVEEIAGALGVQVVPILAAGPLADMVLRCREGFKSTWGDFQAEGIVARPVVEMCNRRGERIITKLKCKDFARVAVGRP